MAAPALREEGRALIEEPLSVRARSRFAVAGLAVLLAAVLVVVAGVRPQVEGARRYRATFGAAGQGMDAGKSRVKVRGIDVGEVESVRLGADGRVTLVLRVDGSVPVPATSRAVIEPVSVFGPKNVALRLGQGPPLPDGGRIARTVDPRDLSGAVGPAYELTRAIDPDDVATLLRAWSSGLAAQGPALRRTLVNGAEVVDGAHANREVIGRLLDDIAGVSGTLGESGDTVTSIVADLNRLGPVVYERPDKVRRLLDEAAEMSARVAGSLRRHGGDAGSLIDGAAPAMDVLADRHRDLPLLMDVLDRFFSGLGGVLHVPGPQGSVLARAVVDLHFPPNLCEIFIDICPAALHPRYNASLGGG